MFGRQRQRGGQGSVNLQAAGDIRVSGLSFTEVRELALDVYRSNATELRGIAESIAHTRAESITTAYLRRLDESAPHLLKALAEPAVQLALADAQKTYVRSGEPDLQGVLVDLLVNRTMGDQWTLQSLALDAAIECVAKLSEAQRRVVALIFALRYARPARAVSIDEYHEYVDRHIAPLIDDLPTRSTHYQHLVFVGVGSASGDETPLGSLLRSGAEGLFTRGFARDAAAPGVFDRALAQGVIMPCLRDTEGTFQIDALAFADVGRIARDRGLEDDALALQRLAYVGWMDDHEVEEEAVQRAPALVELQTAWRETEISGLALTTAGVAIGHAYWSQATGGSTPLSLWLG